MFDCAEPAKKATLADLAYVLRHKELWPANFGPWSYCSADTCAIGLVAALWGMKLDSDFGMARKDSETIFSFAHEHLRHRFLHPYPTHFVTPEDVATLIDQYTEKHPEQAGLAVMVHAAA